MVVGNKHQRGRKRTNPPKNQTWADNSLRIDWRLRGCPLLPFWVGCFRLLLLFLFVILFQFVVLFANKDILHPFVHSECSNNAKAEYTHILTCQSAKAPKRQCQCQSKCQTKCQCQNWTFLLCLDPAIIAISIWTRQNETWNGQHLYRL